nr:MAG TPA: hypothetical protein [Caudoviricetes sp.]
MYPSCGLFIALCICIWRDVLFVCASRFELACRDKRDVLKTINEKEPLL